MQSGDARIDQPLSLARAARTAAARFSPGGGSVGLALG